MFISSSGPEDEDQPEDEDEDKDNHENTQRVLPRTPHQQLASGAEAGSDAATDTEASDHAAIDPLIELHYKLLVKIKGVFSRANSSAHQSIEQAKTWPKVHGISHHIAYQKTIQWCKEQMMRQWSIKRLEVIVDHRGCKKRDIYTTDVSVLYPMDD